MPSRKTANQPVAIEMLIADHESAKDLFNQYEDEKESDAETRRAIAQRVCAELTVHAQVEEEIFYPALRENVDGHGPDRRGRRSSTPAAKDLIAQIEGADEVDEKYDAKVKVLGEYIDHHVKEEENEIFPKVRSKKDALDELGQEMMARKVELMEELGIGEDAPSPAARGSRAKPASQQRTR